MTAYLATFADGSTKRLKNSKANYAAAWKVVVQEGDRAPFSVEGFARDAEAAERASTSEARRLTKADRWTPNGRTLISREVVAAVAS